MNESLVITPGTLRGPVVCAGGRDVVISGNGCEVALTGTCEELKVIGSGHRVRVEAARMVGVLGSNNHLVVDTLGAAKINGTENHLSWKRAMEGRKAPSFSLSGEGNSVSMEAESPVAEIPLESPPG